MVRVKTHQRNAKMPHARNLRFPSVQRRKKGQNSFQPLACPIPPVVELELNHQSHVLSVVHLPDCASSWVCLCTLLSLLLVDLTSLLFWLFCTILKHVLLGLCLGTSVCTSCLVQDASPWKPSLFFMPGCKSFLASSHWSWFMILFVGLPLSLKDFLKICEYFHLLLYGDFSPHLNQRSFKLSVVHCLLVVHFFLFHVWIHWTIYLIPMIMLSASLP